MASFTVRNDAGQNFDVDEDKIDAAEKDGYLPVVSNGQEEHRVAHKDLIHAVKDGYKPLGAAPVSKTESAIRGAAQGATFGFGDELTGAAETAGKTLFGNEKLKDAVDNYSKHRDESRVSNKMAQDDNPWSYGLGEAGGGIASTLATGGLGHGIKGAAALGALGGLGAGEGDVGDQLKSTAIGGAIGGVGGALVKGVQSAVPYLKAAGQGAKIGAKEAIAEVPNVIGVRESAGAVGAIKGALSEIKNQAASSKEFGQVAQEALKVLHPGQNGSIGAAMSGDEAVLGALMQDGDNPVKQWFAKKSAMLNPGAGSSEDYSKLLSMGPEARNTARSFNARDAAKELVPDVEEAQNLFTKARGDRYNELQHVARQTFEPASVNGVLEELGGAAQDAQHPIINGKARTAIEGARTMIEDGKGLRAHGLNEGSLDDVPHEEIFNRLQKAREVIDSNVKWSSAQGDTESEKLLKGVRDKIDSALKTSPEKVEADDVYSQGKRVEDNFFNATEFRKNGQVDIDEGKIARLLGGTDQAKRFQAALQQAKDYAEKPGLSDDFRQKMADLADRMEKKIGVADDQRAINSFRYKAGPSSPAIERLQSSSGNNSLLKDAANAPAGFLNSMDEFTKFVAEKAGQPYSKLPPEQQLGVTKFWTWMKGNQGASEAQLNKAWTKFVGR